MKDKDGGPLKVLKVDSTYNHLIYVLEHLLQDICSTPVQLITSVLLE